MGLKAVFLALYVRNCSPGIVLRRAYVFSSFSFSFFFPCSDTPDKGISDGFDQIWLPREITHLAWNRNEIIIIFFYYYSQNTSMAFSTKEATWVTVSSGICFSPLKVELEERWKQQWQLLGLSLCCSAVELISEENTRSLSLLQCSPLFCCQHPNVNHFLNSFQVIKTLPDRVCSTSKFCFNCLASVSRMGCGHPHRPEAFLIRECCCFIVRPLLWKGPHRPRLADIYLQL